MTLGRYLAAAALLVLVLGSTSLASVTARRRLLPLWRGAPARLSEVILGLGIVLAVSELLGTVGLYRLLPIAIAFAAVGLAAWRLGARRSGSVAAREDEMGGARIRYSPIEVTAAVAAVSLVFAEWSVPTIDAFRGGMTSVDTLWYHLPVAARFVQEGWITHVHFLDNGSVTAFYPASSELLHGLGMMLVGSDALSPIINLGWLALALLAAWCLGRPFGVAPLTLIAAAVVLGTPELVSDEPAGAYNDVVVIALVVATLALLANTARTEARGMSPPTVGVAALAAGLAVGVKYTAIVPILALTVCLIAVTPRGHRLRVGGLWLLVVSLAGGLWYVRNLVVVGNPVPQVQFGLGPLQLHGPPVAGFRSTPADHLFEAHIWRDVFLPGFHDAFGPAWIPLLLLAAVGTLAALIAPRRSANWPSSRIVRTVALVGLATFIGYLFTPQPQPGRLPSLFVYNVRFVAPAVVLGLALVPIALASAQRWRVYAVLTAWGAMLVATQFAVGIWTHGPFTSPEPNSYFGPESFTAGAVAGVAAFFLGAAVLMVRRAPPRLPASFHFATAAALVAVVAAGFPLERSYLSNRYSHPADLGAAAGAPPEIARWADHLHHARIATANLILQYPLYGNDLSNHVQAVGIRGRHGAFPLPQGCAQWRAAVNRGGYGYVVTSDGVGPDGHLASTENPTGWTASDPSAVLKQHADVPAYPFAVRLSAFALRGTLDPGRCR